MLYNQDNRAPTKEENPDASFGRSTFAFTSNIIVLTVIAIGELGKLLGSKWSALTDEEKKPYAEM